MQKEGTKRNSIFLYGETSWTGMQGSILSYSFVLNNIHAKLFKSTNVISRKKKISTKIYTFNFVNNGMEEIAVCETFSNERCH